MTTKLALLSWVIILAVVVLGELLPGTSPLMMWISSTGISDKVLHIGAYALLAGIPMLGFSRISGLQCALAMIPFGIVLEFIQNAVPDRDFDLGDIAANTFGVLVGIGAVWVRRKIRSKVAM